MEFSIIIATCERCDSLRRLLTGIADNFGSSDVDYEVIVANNARDDDMSQRIAEMVEEFQQRHGDHFRLVKESSPGKCKAQNKAILESRGEILAFFDDDVIVTPDWLRVVAQFFREKRCDVMQGPILMPPNLKKNADFLAAHHKFRTINFVQYSPKLTTIQTLTGANMAIRKEVFGRIGYFNEDLGPGRSGISEDVEFAKRFIRSGGTIGYEPQAGVYHEVDWSRLTEEFFRRRHEQQGLSRLIYKKQSCVSIVPNLLRALFSFGWYALNGNVRKQYRAKGRVYHYRAMLKEKLKA